LARRTASRTGAQGGHSAQGRAERQTYSSPGGMLSSRRAGMSMRFGKHGDAARRHATPYSRRLRLEPLEDRCLLALVTVTTLADTVNFNDGVTSLREAIFATNTVPGADTIDFAPSLFANGPGTILLTQGELRITDSLTINGPGAHLLTIDASGNDPTPVEKNGDGSRVFSIDDSRDLSFLDVTINHLTVAGVIVTPTEAGSTQPKTSRSSPHTS